MKLKRKKRKTSIIVPIASMGDIAFLLIIFFMLSSNFIKETNVELEEAESMDIEELEMSSISIAVDENAVIWVDGEQCHIDSLEAITQNKLATQNKKTVMLKIDKNLRHEQYGKVLMELSKAGAEIALVGKQIKE